MAKVTFSAESAGGDFAPIPDGSYAGSLCEIFLYGTHTSTYAGKSKQAVKAVFIWEVGHNPDNQTKQPTVFQFLNISGHPDAGLTAMLKTWLGATAVEPGASLELADLLDKRAWLTISVYRDKAGKPRNKGDAATRLSPHEPYQPTRDCRFWDVNDDPGLADPELPAWLARLAGDSAEHIKWKNDRDHEKAVEAFGVADGDKPKPAGGQGSLGSGGSAGGATGAVGATQGASYNGAPVTAQGEPAY